MSMAPSSAGPGTASTEGRGRLAEILALTFLFASGAAALGQQVLWTRSLVDLLGASADTFSKVIGAFFVGLALGGGWTAWRPASPAQAWRRIALAEFAIAILGMGVLASPPVLGRLADGDGMTVLLRGLAPPVLIIPPAFAMGLVLPALASAVPGASASIRYYTINTLGGVAGIGLILWVGLPHLGLVGAGWATSGVNLMLAASMALWRPASPTRSPSPDLAASTTAGLSARRAAGLALASGFLVLGLEVICQHQFAQVSINSSFSSAAVLAGVLIALTIASSGISRSRGSLGPWLNRAGLGAGIACLLEPVLFLVWRPGLETLPYNLPPLAYFAVLGGLVAGTLIPLFTAAGLLFPLLLRDGCTPRRLGLLLAFNGAGGWLGAELTPALILPHLGLWLSPMAFGLAYVVVTAPFPSARGSSPPAADLTGPWRRWRSRIGFSVAWVILGVAARSWHQTSRGPGETIVEVAVGREGVVAVVKGETNDWRILFNNTYTLGGSRAAANQERQALLPILIHGHAQTAGVLGVATGSTLAGATLDPALASIDAFELSPLAAHLAQRHFQPFNRGAFQDPRVHLHLDDARWGVSRRTGAYDVVIGDLFLPWRTGEGRLFSVDHFEAVRRALRSDGLFCQWLPLFQLTRPQYDLIARSFATVFTNAFLIRGDFYTELPILGLCAFADGRPFRQIDWETLESSCGRIRHSSAGTRDPLIRHPEGVALCLLGPLPDPGPGPVNTLANARLEWDAGKNIVGLQQPWFVGVPAAEYFKEVHRSGSRQIPTALQAAHDSGQFFLTLEIAAKVQAPVLENLRAQVPERLPRALSADPQVDWLLWPMRIKPFRN